MLNIILTSDKTSWALRPLIYTIRNYWSVELNVLVGGYTPPPFALPPHYWQFKSLGDFADYPTNKWSDGLIKFLQGISTDLVLLHFDDFWLIRPVDRHAIVLAQNYMNDNPNVIRFDLTSDRLYAGGVQDAGHCGYLDLVRAPSNSPYNFSYQTGIWRRESLLKCLAPGESAAESEIAGDLRIQTLGFDVVGTRQIPVKYCIAVQHGQLTLDGGYQGPRHALNPQDAAYIRGQGWIPETLTGGYA
jgi:hypothetical protein